MSVRVSSWVWHSRECADVNGNELVLLLSLADVADDNGFVRYVAEAEDLSYDGLARKVRVDRRTIERLVPKLRAAGILRHERGARGRVNEFRIVVPWAKSDKMSANAGVDSPTAVQDSPTAVQGFPDNVSGRSSMSRRDVERGERKRSSTAQGSRLPEGWRPSSETIAYTAKVAPSVVLEVTLEAFADYWRAQAGSRGRKADWDLTWKTWVRREHSDNVRRGWTPPAVVSARSARMRDATAELQAEQKRSWLAERDLTEGEWDAMEPSERQAVISRG